jgi:hypothetical protein
MDHILAVHLLFLFTALNTLFGRHLGLVSLQSWHNDTPDIVNLGIHQCDVHNNAAAVAVCVRVHLQGECRGSHLGPVRGAASREEATQSQQTVSTQ